MAFAAAAISVLADDTVKSRTQKAMEAQWAYMTAGSGEWRTPNPNFGDAPGAARDFGVRFKWGPHRQHVKGELYGVFEREGGDKEVLFWTFFSYHNPVTDEIVLTQVGANGSMATGVFRDSELSDDRLDQTLYGADGTVKHVRHESTHTSETVHASDVYERDDQGEWKLARQWTWTRVESVRGVGGAQAEEAKKPQIARMERGPAQEKLGKFAGTWKTRQTIKFGGEEATVEDVETYSWMEPTGVWLMKQVTKADHPIIGPMNGVELWAYDARTDEIVRYWFDSQSTESFPNRGKWTDDSTLLMTGMIVWEGRNMYLKNIYAFDGPDEFVWTHYQSWDTDDNFIERGRFEYTRAAGD